MQNKKFYRLVILLLSFILLTATTIFSIKDLIASENNIDLLILIDDSRSMSKSDPNNNRLNSVDYCSNFLQQHISVKQNHRIGLIRFGTDVIKSFPLNSVEKVSIQNLPSILDSKYTDFNAALKVAYEEFEEKGSFKADYNAQIIIITDGTFEGSTKEFARFRKDEFKTEKLREALITRLEKWIIELGKRGCKVNIITVGSSEEDKDVWKKFAFSSDGLFYGINKIPNIRDLEANCEKILSKALNLYKVNLINPKSTQTSKESIFIKAVFLRDSVIIKNPTIIINTIINRPSQILDTLTLTCNKDGLYYFDYREKPEMGNYSFKFAVQDGYNILLDTITLIRVTKPSIGFSTILLIVLLLMTAVIAIIILIKNIIRKGKQISIKKYQKKAKSLMKEGDIYNKKELFDEANKAYFEAGEAIIKIGAIYDVQVTSMYFDVFEKTYHNWITEMSKNKNDTFNQRLTYKKDRFKELLITFCKDKSEISNRKGIAKMLSSVIIIYDSEDIFENIIAMLSLRDIYKDVKSHISDIFLFTRQYLIDMEKEMKLNKKMHERIDIAHNGYKAYCNLLNVNEKNVNITLNEAVIALEKIRNYNEQTEHFYQYYSNIFETFRPILDNKKPHKIFLTTIRDYIENNKNNWERCKP